MLVFGRNASKLLAVAFLTFKSVNEFLIMIVISVYVGKLQNISPQKS